MPVMVVTDDSGQKTFRSVTNDVWRYWNVPGRREKCAWDARKRRAEDRGAPQCPHCGCFDEFHNPTCRVFVGMVERLSALAPEVAEPCAQPTLCAQPNCEKPEWLDGLCFAHARAVESMTDIPIPERKEGGWMI